MRSKGPYWIPKNRRQELRYFTLQYWDYKRKVQETQYLACLGEKGAVITIRNNWVFRPSDVEKVAIESTRYTEYIKQIDQVVKDIHASLEEILDNCKRNVNTGQMTLFYWKLDKLHT